MKIKKNSRMIIKKHDGETYFFKNGVAKVPGMTNKNTGKPYTINLIEFKELTG